MNGIFQVEDNRIGAVQCGVDEVFRLGTREVKARTAEASASGWLGQGDWIRENGFSCAQPGTLCGGLDASGNYEWESAFIVNRNVSVLDKERIEHLACLREDGFAVIGGHAGFQGDFKAPIVAGFEADVEVGADVFAPVSGFGGVHGVG
jgi:hypothetical protein